MSLPGNRRCTHPQTVRTVLRSSFAVSIARDALGGAGTDETAGNRGRDHYDDQRCTNVSEDVSDGRALSIVDCDGNDNDEKDGADNEPSCLRRASTVLALRAVA